MTIGIIGAMDEEISYLSDNMIQKQSISIADSRFLWGELYGEDVVLLKSGIGKVNASIAATIMFERFHPDRVINTGSAGGHREDLEVGDIVLSSEVAYHDVDVTGFGYTYGQVPHLPEVFTADPALVQYTRNALEQSGIVYAEGMIVTGDSFMDDPLRIDRTKKHFPDMIAMEMEAAAIAQVCHRFQCPFVIIRSLSDIAGKEATVSFNEFLEQASRNAAQAIMEMIRGMT